MKWRREKRQPVNVEQNLEERWKQIRARSLWLFEKFPDLDDDAKTTIANAAYERFLEDLLRHVNGR